MQLKVEGILLAKTVYRERDLVCKILLRSGKQISVLFYGGQGGGKKGKSSILEIGHMLKIELRRIKKVTELYTAKEWNSLWFYNHIRLDYKAFYLICTFVEVISKIAQSEDLSDQYAEFSDESEGLFRVLSNAIFFLDQSLKMKKFSSGTHFFIFLTKLLYELGVIPSREGCTFCEKELHQEKELFLVAQHGGFSCMDCISERKNGNLGFELWRKIGDVSHRKYDRYDEIEEVSWDVCKLLFGHFCYQFNLNEKQFKSLSLL